MKAFARFGLVLAVLLPAVSLQARAEDVLHVGKAAPFSSPKLPLDVGVKIGAFARHGLDVEVANFQAGGKLHQALAAGSMDLGIGSGPELALVAKGAPELAVCNEVPSAGGLGVMVPANSTAQKLADLRGKRIGISSTGSLTDWLAQELARKQGWRADDIKVVAIGNAATVAAFRAGVVDADIGPTTTAFLLELHQQGRLLAPVSAYEGNISGSTIFATNALMADNPEAIRRFLAAWLDTIAWMRAHKDGTVQIESVVSGLPPEVMAREYDLTIGMFSTTCRFDQESLDNLKRSFMDLKLLETAPDMTKLYTEAYLPKQ